jgi:hypothetical protein
MRLKMRCMLLKALSNRKGRGSESFPSCNSSNIWGKNCRTPSICVASYKMVQRGSTLACPQLVPKAAVGGQSTIHMKSSPALPIRQSKENLMECRLPERGILAVPLFRRRNKDEEANPLFPAFGSGRTNRRISSRNSPNSGRRSKHHHSIRKRVWSRDDREFSPSSAMRCVTSVREKAFDTSRMSAGGKIGHRTPRERRFAAE